MALIQRDEVPAPVLPEETVAVAELGGEVIVRGLLLKDRLTLITQSGETQDFSRVAKVLAITVFDGALRPLWDAGQWEAWGAGHTRAALDLFRVAMRLSGLNAETEGGN